MENKYFVSETDLTEENERPLLINDDHPSFQIYKQRWVILLIFSLNTMASGALFMGISSISSISANYYGVSNVSVELTSNGFLFVYVIAALPFSYHTYKLGMRPMLIAASAVQVFATGFHYLGREKNGFKFILVGQLFGALAFSSILQIPGRLSSVWFPDNERGTATAIGVFMNLVGVAIGFLQPTHIVTSTDLKDVSKQFHVLYLSQLITCGAFFVVTILFFREKPPSPPCSSHATNETASFLDYMKMLIKDKYFVFMCQSYGINYGLLVSFSVLLNSIVSSKYHGYDNLIGWMGFACTSVGIFSCLLTGLWLDKSKSYRCTAIFLNTASMVTWLAFYLIFSKTNSFNAVFVLFTIFGAFSFPYFAAGLEQAAEMTYPVPEETSGAVLLIFGSFYGFCLILLFGYMIELGYVELVGYAFVGLYLMATVLAAVAKTQTKRLLAEKQNNHS